MRYPGMKSKVINTITVSFSLFILWVIYTADTGGTIVFTEMIRFLPFPDKWGHMLLFGFLTLLLNLTLKGKRISVRSYKPYLGTVLVSIFVVIEELSQGFLDTRSMDYLDLLADGLGIWMFTWLTDVASRRFNLA